MKRTERASLAPPRRGKGSAAPTQVPLVNINPKLELIQTLIPIAMERVEELLQDEVARLAGPRYAHDDQSRDYKRWGKQRGSVYLAGQKVPLMIPRVRDVKHNCEVPLEIYQQLQQPHAGDEKLFVKILHGLPCQQYENAARLIPQASSLSRSTVSRRFVRSSAKKLDVLLSRRLDSEEFVALVLDGKAFGEAQMIMALGIATSGEKRILGFVESGTENSRVCADFLKSLIDRGLRYQQGLLVGMDGSKGLRKAIAEVFGDHAVVQRCQWHKRENIVAYLPKSQQAEMRQKLQRAYEQPTYEKAKPALLRLRGELKLLNQSAVSSLDEGFEETLTLHRLGVFKELGISLKTTNSIESVNSHVERLTRKITSWRNSSQRQRWLASALLAIEPRLRKLKGYRYIPMLQRALQNGSESRS